MTCNSIIRSTYLTALAVSVMSTVGAHAAAQVTPLTRDVVRAFREGGLEAAAALVGHFVWSEDGDVRSTADDLFALSQESAVVVRARVSTEFPSVLSGGGMSITTAYGMTVAESFQGDLQSGAQVTVRMIGGTVTFGN